MKAFTILRVSTPEQKKKYGFPSQWEDDILPGAQILGLEVSDSLCRKIDETATRGERLDFAQSVHEAIGLFRNGEIEALLFPRVDRESRDPFISIPLLNECFANGLPVYFAREELYLDPHDLEAKKKYTDAVSRAMDYIITLRRNLSRGLRQRAKSGKLPGGRSVHLFGYDYSDGKRIPNEKSQIVIDMFMWVAEGASENRVVERLNELGALTPTGKTRWNMSTVNKILNNKAYIGKPKAYYGIEIANCTPPIISEALFNEVQDRLKANQRSAPRNTKTEYLLRGHVYCVKCHRKYYVHTMHKKQRCYYCSGRLKCITSQTCDNKTHDSDYLEAKVWHEIWYGKDGLLNNPNFIDELERRANEDNGVELETELGTIEKRLKELAKEQENLLGWAVKGFPEDMVEKENAKIIQYQLNLQERAKELHNRIAQAKQREFDIAGLKHFCELAKNNLAKFTFSEKRIILDTLRIEVWVDGDKILITGAVPTCDIGTTQLKLGHQG